MKTQDILTLPEAKLAPQLAHLKVKELERHAQKILLKNGGGDYNQLIRTIIQTIPKTQCRIRHALSRSTEISARRT